MSLNSLLDDRLAVGCSVATTIPPVGAWLAEDGTDVDEVVFILCIKSDIESVILITGLMSTSIVGLVVSVGIGGRRLGLLVCVEFESVGIVEATAIVGVVVETDAGFVGISVGTPVGSASENCSSVGEVVALIARGVSSMTGEVTVGAEVATDATGESSVD